MVVAGNYLRGGGGVGGVPGDYARRGGGVTIHVKSARNILNLNYSCVIGLKLEALFLKYGANLGAEDASDAAIAGPKAIGNA